MGYFSKGAIPIAAILDLCKQGFDNNYIRDCIVLLNQF